MGSWKPDYEPNDNRHHRPVPVTPHDGVRSRIEASAAVAGILDATWTVVWTDRLTAAENTAPSATAVYSVPN